jgi:hypothetical protein
MKTEGKEEDRLLINLKISKIVMFFGQLIGQKRKMFWWGK